jgi:putative N6-adenine-specific DNA methylase
MQKYRYYAVCTPGLEDLVSGELESIGAQSTRSHKGGVAFSGSLSLMMEANLHLRCATRVLMRIHEFYAVHLAQLDKRSRKMDWTFALGAAKRIRIKASCRRSRIYHSGAAKQRIASAIQSQTQAIVVDQEESSAPLILVRIENDLCTISLDTSGEPLYRRSTKREVSAAPLRETLAAAGLSMCGYDGSQAFWDPMCGSGTLPMEASAIALGLAPGLHRFFAFQSWANYDEQEWQRIRSKSKEQAQKCLQAPILASDVLGGAVEMTKRNLERSGLLEAVRCTRASIEDLQAPAPRGIMLCNPPYGVRLEHDATRLKALYRALGRTFKKRFNHWTLGLFTAHQHLANATGLNFTSRSSAWSHGGIRIRLYQCRAPG